ncbi:MAG: hypothetical protein AAF674_16890 [Pseudomonadota bacterium]
MSPDLIDPNLRGTKRLIVVILALGSDLRGNCTISIRDLAAWLGTAPATAQQHVDELTDAKVISRVGSVGNTASYRVLSPSMRKQAQSAPAEKSVAEIAASELPEPSAPITRVGIDRGSISYEPHVNGSAQVPEPDARPYPPESPRQADNGHRAQSSDVIAIAKHFDVLQVDGQILYWYRTEHTQQLQALCDDHNIDLQAVRCALNGNYLGPKIEARSMADLLPHIQEMLA